MSTCAQKQLLETFLSSPVHSQIANALTSHSDCYLLCSSQKNLCRTCFWPDNLQWRNHVRTSVITFPWLSNEQMRANDHDNHHHARLINYSNRAWCYCPRGSVRVRGMYLTKLWQKRFQVALTSFSFDLFWVYWKAEPSLWPGFTQLELVLAHALRVPCDSTAWWVLVFKRTNCCEQLSTYNIVFCSRNENRMKMYSWWVAPSFTFTLYPANVAEAWYCWVWSGPERSGSDKLQVRRVRRVCRGTSHLLMADEMKPTRWKLSQDAEVIIWYSLLKVQVHENTWLLK